MSPPPCNPNPRPEAESDVEAGAIYQRLAVTLPAIVYRLHLRHGQRVQFITNQVQAITGYRCDELGDDAAVGSALAPLILDDDRQRVANEVASAVAANRPLAVEYRLRHKDGGIRYLAERGVPVPGPDGQPAYLDGMIFDLTSQKLVEERLTAELREISTLHAQILSSAEEGIIVYGADLRYRVWNPCMERITGRSAAEVLGRHPREVFPFLREAGVIDRLERTLRGEVTPTIEFANLADGAEPYGWTSDSSVPLRDADGTIIGVLGIVRDITLRKRAEIALQQSENMLKTIIDTEPECVKLLDAEARVILMNRAGLAMLEAEDLAQVKGQCVCPMIVSEHWPAFLDLTQRVFRGESGSLVFEMVGVKGRHLWLETHAVPLRNEGNDIVALLGVTRDITASRQAEAALIESRERYRALYDGTPILLHSIDRAGIVVEVNQYWLTTMGYERQEVLGRLVTDFYTEESRRYALDVVQPAFFRDGFCTNVPFQFVKKSGEVVDVILSASGERDATGMVVCSRAVIRDVTEQKRADEALRQSEQLVRSIIDTVDEGFIVLDREYRILSANKSFCRQTGTTEAEAIGRYCFEVSHKQTRPCHENNEECAIKRVFATGAPSVALHTHADEHGNLRYVETRGFPLADAAGEITSAIEVIHDVTDRYRLEAEQLKTQKLEAIGTLAGGIAHDFNNLLQGVFGYLSLAKLRIDRRDEALAALNQAEKALALSTQLTMQLLTFSKGGKPVKKLVGLGAVIENATKFALSGSPCQSQVRNADGLWPVEADAGQIGQVIQNIVLNAAQAMPEGGRITVSADNLRLPDGGLSLDLAAGPYVVIAIGDTGPGISAKDLPRIFDPYFTTKAAGSGLGLATSYSIVKNHDGLITVKSEPGQGTTFSVYLPATVSAAVRPHGPAESVAAVAPSTPAAGRVLVMDDDPVIRDVAGQMLRALGHEVEFAVHGEEALAHYWTAQQAGRPFTAVILDLTIRGGMGGFETMRNLREIDPAVKAVVSSGYSDDATLADYQQYGFRACLNKPYSLHELRQALSDLLR